MGANTRKEEHGSVLLLASRRRQNCPILLLSFNGQVLHWESEYSKPESPRLLPRPTRRRENGWSRFCIDPWLECREGHFDPRLHLWAIHKLSTHFYLIRCTYTHIYVYTWCRHKFPVHFSKSKIAFYCVFAMRQLRRWKRLWRRSLIRSHKRNSMEPSRSCCNGTTSALQPEGITSKGTRVSYVYYQ